MRTISHFMAGAVARMVVAATLVSLLFSGCATTAVEGPARG